MALIFNGTEPSIIKYKSGGTTTELTKVIYNGVVVWESYKELFIVNDGVSNPDSNPVNYTLNPEKDNPYIESTIGITASLSYDITQYKKCHIRCKVKNLPRPTYSGGALFIFNFIDNLNELATWGGRNIDADYPYAYTYLPGYYTANHEIDRIVNWDTGKCVQDITSACNECVCIGTSTGGGNFDWYNYITIVSTMNNIENPTFGDMGYFDITNFSGNRSLNLWGYHIFTTYQSWHQPDYINHFIGIDIDISWAKITT